MSLLELLVLGGERAQELAQAAFEINALTQKIIAFETRRDVEKIELIEHYDGFRDLSLEEVPPLTFVQVLSDQLSIAKKGKDLKIFTDSIDSIPEQAIRVLSKIPSEDPYKTSIVLSPHLKLHVKAFSGVWSLSLFALKDLTVREDLIVI